MKPSKIINLIFMIIAVINIKACGAAAIHIAEGNTEGAIPASLVRSAIDMEESRVEEAIDDCTTLPLTLQQAYVETLKEKTTNKLMVRGNQALRANDLLKTSAF